MSIRRCACGCGESLKFRRPDTIWYSKAHRDAFVRKNSPEKSEPVTTEMRQTAIVNLSQEVYRLRTALAGVLSTTMGVSLYHRSTCRCKAEPCRKCKALARMLEAAREAKKVMP